jgi:hypothetical protein
MAFSLPFRPVVSARPSFWQLVTSVDRIQMRGKGFLRPPRRGEARNDPARRQSHRVKLSIRTLKVGNPLKPCLHLGDVRTRVVGPLVEAGILPANQALLSIGAGEDKQTQDHDSSLLHDGRWPAGDQGSGWSSNPNERERCRRRWLTACCANPNHERMALARSRMPPLPAWPQRPAQALPTEICAQQACGALKSKRATRARYSGRTRTSAHVGGPNH